MESRTGGNAAKHLAPRMRDGAPNKFQSVDEMFKHLESIFLDPNRQINARRKLRTLQMKPTDRYHDFLTEFLYLTGEAGIPESEYKEELYERLTYKLKEMLVFCRNDGSTFEEFSTRCSYAANSLQSITESRNQNRANEKTNTASLRTEKRYEEAGSTPTTAAMASTRARTYPAHLTVEQQSLMKTGSCFYCKAPGHLAKDCPSKRGTTALKVLEPSIDKGSRLSENEGA